MKYLAFIILYFISLIPSLGNNNTKGWNKSEIQYFVIKSTNSVKSDEHNDVYAKIIVKEETNTNPKVFIKFTGWGITTNTSITMKFGSLKPIEFNVTRFTSDIFLNVSPNGNFFYINESEIFITYLNLSKQFTLYFADCMRVNVFDFECEQPLNFQ